MKECRTWRTEIYDIGQTECRRQRRDKRCGRRGSPSLPSAGYGAYTPHPGHAPKGGSHGRSDTDSSFVSLDAWYQYNIQYLKNYDSPILHQKIDVFKYIEEEEKKEINKEYWENGETPEWYNAIGKEYAIKFAKVDEFGDVVDPHFYDAISFEDPELDYDFYNEEIIERKRMQNPMEIIPQDNMRFALVNIMCYILTSVINLYMIEFKCK